MSTEKVALEHTMQLCRVWFMNHKAEVKKADEVVTVIYWQNPDTWNYACRYFIHRRWLMVVGDLGEAIYEWGQDISLEFLSKLDFHYFHGKCRSSVTGCRYQQWDSNVAYTNLSSLGFDSQLLDGLNRNSCEDEYRNVAKEVFDATGDPDTASAIASCGLIPHLHAVAHFTGLQMAIEQLTPATV